MTARTPGPFEYFTTTGAAIEAAADAPDGHARTLAVLADDLDLDASRASAATEGEISGLVAVSPRETGTVARSLAQKGSFAAACLRTFARHVDLFDFRVNALNAQVADAAATAETDLAKLLLEPLGGSKAASDATYRELLPRYQRAQGDLDDVADQVAGWLRRGPTDRILHRLVRNGLMPLAAASAFPHLALTPSDIYLAKAAEAAKGLVPPEILAQGPDVLDDYLVKHHDIASKLSHRSDDSALTNLLTLPSFGTRGVGIRDMLKGTSPAERRRLSALSPAMFGNNPDAPFDMRAQANRVRISGQMHDDQQEIKRLQSERSNGPGAAAERNAIDDRIDQLRERHKLYDGILTDRPARDGDGRAPAHRTIIAFDPRGDGSMAELHGVLDKNTKNLGVYVPGTGHGLDDWGDSARRSTNFVKDSSGAAMITWIGGDLPDSVVPDAVDQKYAKHAGPLLSDFSHQVRNELDDQGIGAAPKYMGHSYGGAIVGQAERYGLDTRGVLMIEGAGMGPDVHDVDDLHPSNRRTPHYSMTAPGDPIATAQNSGHLGSDPDTFGEAIPLQTGRDKDGKQIDGIAAHAGVLKRDSDSYNNMLAFLNGTTASLRHDDDMHVDPKAGAMYVPNFDSGGTVRIR